MESFNPQVDISQIPKVDDLVFQPLQREYLTVSLLSRLIFYLILGSAVFMVFWLEPFYIDPIIRKLVLLAFSLYLLWSFLALIMGFKNKAYALRSRDIVYKSGWLWQSTTTAPFNRVQHVVIDQGLIERQFELSKLKVFTAGGGSSDLTIPGLHPSTANMLKEYIVKKTGQDEEE